MRPLIVLAMVAASAFAPAAQSGGTPTLTAPPPVRPALTRSELMISQNFGPSGEAQYFADGPRIPGVTSIQYSFRMPTAGATAATWSATPPCAPRRT